MSALAEAVGESVLSLLQTGLTQEDVIGVTLNPSNHVYWAELTTGKKRMFKSITAILKMIAKDSLITWAANCAAEYVLANLQVGDVVTEASKNRLADNCKKEHWRRKEESAELGTIAHKFCERWLKGENIGIELGQADRRVKNCVALFWDAWEAKGLTVIHSEILLYDASLGLAGMCDLVCKYPDGRICVVDLKTGNGIWPEMFLQLSAYVHMLSFKGIDVDNVEIWRIGKHDAIPSNQHIPKECWQKSFVGLLAAFVLARLVDKSGMINKFLQGDEVTW